MNLLEEFLSQMSIFSPDFEDDIQHTSDLTDFVIVDGEEADYGVIRYLDPGGSILAIRTVHGGDMEEIDFTDFGVNKLMPLAKKWFENKTVEMQEKSLKI